MHIIRISSAAITEKGITEKAITGKDTTGEDTAERINMDVTETAAVIKLYRNTPFGKIA